MILYNTTDKEQSVKAFGNWFSFKPGQLKNIREEFGTFIVLDKKEYGIVALPDDFEDPSFQNTEEGQRIMAEKRIEGRSNRVRHIQRVMHNEQVSLRQDLEKNGQRINPDLFATDEVVAMYEELAAYKKADDDARHERLNKIVNIKKKLNE